MEEVRKDIPWYEGIYKVSNIGNVSSVDRTDFKRWRKLLWKTLSKVKHESWYSLCALSKLWHTRNYYIHVLVCLAFIWEKNWLYVNHKDWNKSNNDLNNLEYVTASENVKHAYRIWLSIWKSNMKWKFWKDHFWSKHIIQYDLLWNTIQEYIWISYAQRITWIKTIQSALNWYQKTAWWYRREYAD